MMANGIVLNLDTTKSEFQNPMIELRQGDGNYQSLDVTVTSNGEPFDLTGWSITFMGTTAGNFKIIDGAVTVTNALQGTFKYTPTKAWGQDEGEFKNAYFSFVKSEKTASSAAFRVNVLTAVDLTAAEAGDYISIVDKTIDQLTADLSGLVTSVADLKSQNLAIKATDNTWTGANKFAKLIDGYTKTKVSPSTDLNSIKTSGKYELLTSSTYTNAPSGIPNNAILIVENSVDNGTTYQYVLSRDTVNQNTDMTIFFRVSITNNWSSWQQIAKDSKVVHNTGTETISGPKTFTDTIVGSITGNAGSATKLQTARKINGTPFDGSSDIQITGSSALPVGGVYPTISDLLADNPNHNNVYITTDNGNWNYWDQVTSTWKSGGV